MTLKYLLPIIGIVLCLFPILAGCVHIASDNSSIQANTTLSSAPVVSPTPSPTPFVPKNINATQAEAVVRAFAGNPDLKLTYEGVGGGGKSFIFGSDEYQYTVKNATGRVWLMYPTSGEWNRGQPEIITVDQGREIAEKFANEKYPELWQVSANRELKFTQKVMDHGSGGREFQYRWQEVMYRPDKQTKNHVTIMIPNDVVISVSPYTGRVSKYSESYFILDPEISLDPTVTADQAADRAIAFLATKGVTGVLPSEVSEKYLTISGQGLAWFLEIDHKTGPSGYLTGGGVMIDAHDGSVIRYTAIA